MANLNITNIPAPRVPFIDERTGLMAREWYRFFLNLFVLTGSGNNPITLEELQLGPPSQPSLAELLIQINQNIAPQYEDQSGDFLATLDTAQLMSMMSRFENAEAAIQGAYLQPPQLPVDGVYVVGPGSSTDNAVARFDGTTGKLIQNSVTTIDDTGNASGILSQQFSDGTAVTLAAGKLWYNGTTGSWNGGMGNGNITQQIGEEIFIYGKASAAITDSPLQIIYKTGVVGASGVVTFAPTIAGITEADQILGIATESLAHNDFGRITTFGIVRAITTNGTAFGEVWADNDDIYYNPVTGNPTKTKPVAPNIKVQLGTIINAGSGGSGSFFVNIGSSSVLGGTDANVQFGTLANNNLIAYDSAVGYWKNVTASSIGLGTVSSVSVVSANGLAGTVATATTTPAITLSTTVTGLLKGNGTAISAATSGTDYAPATSGTSILYGNGSGGFNNVTIGTGVAFTTGTLSATGSGGTVTSVAALTLGTTGTDLSSTVANGTTTPVITLQVPTASAANRGALSAADWTTFNNKLTSGGALGTPSSGTVTNLTGTASININGTVGATTANTGAFTTLSATGAASIDTTAGAGTTHTGLTVGSLANSTNSTVTRMLVVGRIAGGDGEYASIRLNQSTDLGASYAGIVARRESNNNGVSLDFTVNGTGAAATPLTALTLSYTGAASLVNGLAVTGVLSATSEIIGGSSGSGFSFASEIVGGTNGTLLAKNVTSANNVITSWNSATSGDNVFVGFGTEGTFTARGSITYNRAGGLVAYNVTSDYRSKDITGKYEGSGKTIDQLQVYMGKMKGATIARPMMIAHEAQAVVPYAVTGEKDATDKNGNPVYQSMDHQIFVPLLIAEIQSLRSRVALLETK